MEPEGSLPCPQESSTGLYPEPDAQSMPPHPISLRSVLLCFFHFSLGLPCGRFPFAFLSKLCVQIYPTYETVCGRPRWQGPLPESRIPGGLARPMRSVSGRRQYSPSKGSAPHGSTVLSPITATLPQNGLGAECHAPMHGAQTEGTPAPCTRAQEGVCS